MVSVKNWLDDSVLQPLQFESAWVITNIASGTTSHVAAVVRQGALPNLIKLLGHPNVELVEQSIWALSNIAGDSLQYRDMLLHNYPVCALMNNIINKAARDLDFPNRTRLLRTTVWGINNFVKGAGH